MAAVAALLLIFTLGVVFGLPPVYRSTATILIEQQEIPEDLVRSTITSFADQRIQIISQRVMTRSNLQEIIRKYNLYPDDIMDEPMEVIIEQMRDDIQMNIVSADVIDPRSGRPTQATIAFTLSYSYKVPALAQKVANELVSLYLNENLKTRKEMTAQTAKFLEDETDKMSRHIADLEQQLAEFKENNGSQLPDMLQLNMNILDRTERELADAERDIRATNERKIYLESQITMVDPFSVSYGEHGERILGPADRLKQLKSELTQKVAILSDRHPDVIRLQKQIESLQASLTDQENADHQLADLEAQRELALDSYSADHPTVKRLDQKISAMEKKIAEKTDTATSVPSVDSNPDNPSYIQLQAQLESTNIDLASFQKKADALAAKLKDYEQRIMESPQVERRYRELSRDYDNAWARYKELKNKQMEAQLAKVLESERKGERFTLIEPPELPEKPIKPNRLAIFILGMMLSLAAGAGIVIVSDQLDQSIRGRGAIGYMVNTPLLAGVPYIETRHDIQGRRRRVIFSVSGAMVTVLVGLVLAHYFFNPLDVLWFMLLHKAGI